MCHAEVTNFFKRVLTEHAEHRRGHVIEWGSLDINGSPRGLFPHAASYIGVDVAEGPGVDWVGWAHEFPLDREWDVSVSGEMLEHDPFWEKSLERMVKALRDGGLLMLTCAAPGRGEHGTRRHTPFDNPKISSMPEYWDYFRPVSPEEVVARLQDAGMKTVSGQLARRVDTQVWGVK